MNTMTTPIPSELLDDNPAERQQQVRSWWAELSPAAQEEFARMWDERTDDTAYAAAAHDEGIEWHPLPIELVGRFVDEQDELDHDEAKQSLLEFVNNHEEIGFFLVRRGFHICRAHKAAQDVICKGFLSADFKCPLDDENCPMRTIAVAAGGRNVAFDVKLQRRRV